jgi:signal transduction histidine kinase
LFTPLFTTKSKGQGFGLAVVKRLIEAQDGEVTYRTQNGKGTTFTLQLPLNKQDFNV